MTAFEELAVIPELGEAVAEIGWELPTPIQSEAIPAILGGGDVLIAAETGSGKTGAFCLPVAQIVWEKRKEVLEPHSGTDCKEWKLNVMDRDGGLAVDRSGMVCESRAQKIWNGSRCRGGVHSKGKYYFEVKIENDGLCRIGWSTLSATRQLGTDDKSYGFGGTGKKSHMKRFEDYGESFTVNDVLGCYLDLDNLNIWWSKNGKQYPVAYSIPPKMRDPANALHPSVLLQCSALHLNFGETSFAFPPGGSFVGVSQASSDCQSWYSEDLSQLARIDLSNAPLCVVLEPTRELVEQTHNNLVLFGKKLTNPPIRSRLLASGVPIKQILTEIEDGADIVTGTASRILDLVENDALSVQGLQFIVIDEADHILGDRAMASVLNRLMEKLPRMASDGSRLQVIVCSATLRNASVQRFADHYMHFPQWIDLKGMVSVAETVHHVVCPVDAEADKQWIRIMHTKNRLEDDFIHRDDEIRPGTRHKETLSLGTKILKGIYVLRAIEALNMVQAIIFCRTKQQCDQLETYLNQNGKQSTCLHGDRAPQERSRALASFKSGETAFLICTDVAARGIDVSGIPFVINVTLPDDKAVYVHRIGRVGRAERMGLSISLVSTHEEKVWYHKCATKGVGCHKTRDIKENGCTIWYNEPKLLAEVEEHLGVTIGHVNSDFQIPTDEFEGRIIYGAKRTQSVTFEGHARSLAASVGQLSDLERSLQNAYLLSVTAHYEKIAKTVK
ncbi:unnamed protein product, partial [Mesorhabditis belari]|uniref:ATP-dependent RNA helicase n=1 Tax=Mesorhabditis belari TaxID=2138241 RepID=A0AAF3EFR3_9BILA